MANLLSSEYFEQTLGPATFGIVDEECAEDAYGPDPIAEDSWLSADRGMAYSLCPSGVVDLRMRWESWDAEPPEEPGSGGGSWARSEAVAVELPSGVLGVDLIDGDWDEAVFSLPAPGTYAMRFSWCFRPRETPYWSPVEGAPDVDAAHAGHEEELAEADAFCRVQFWPTDADPVSS